MSTNPFANVLADLGIDSSDLFTDPAAFIKRMVNKASDLAAELNRNNTIQTQMDEFKGKALKDVAARDRATELFNVIQGMILDESAEVVANLLPMMPELTSTMTNMIHSMSMRSSTVNSLSKKHNHLLYIKLRDVYEKYCKFMQAFMPENFPANPPIIPAKQGNFSDAVSNSGVKLYKFYLRMSPGTEPIEFISPFALAVRLGFTIKTFMDLPEIVEASEGRFVVDGNEVLVTMKEI